MFMYFIFYFVVFLLFIILLYSCLFVGHCPVFIAFVTGSRKTSLNEAQVIFQYRQF